MKRVIFVLLSACLSVSIYAYHTDEYQEHYIFNDSAYEEEENKFVSLVKELYPELHYMTQDTMNFFYEVSPNGPYGPINAQDTHDLETVQTILQSKKIKGFKKISHNPNHLGAIEVLIFSMGNADSPEDDIITNQTLPAIIATLFPELHFFPLGALYIFFYDWSHFLGRYDYIPSAQPEPLDVVKKILQNKQIHGYYAPYGEPTIDSIKFRTTSE